MKDESENIKDIREAQNKRLIAQDIYFLRRLLKNINTENITFKELEPIVKMQNYKGTVFIESERTICRHVSILALMNFFNKKTSYEIIPLDTIVDIWFNKLEDQKLKKAVYNSDVLILHGNKALTRAVGPLERVLIEVIEARRVFNKNTWIFANKAESHTQNIYEYIDRTYSY